MRRPTIVLAAIGCLAYMMLVKRLTPPGAQNLFWLELSFTPGDFLDVIRSDNVGARDALRSVCWPSHDGAFIARSCADAHTLRHE